jgi:hypothetical protein
MRKFVFGAVAVSALAFASQSFAANAVNLNSPEWLGQLKLDKNQLGKIKTAVEGALNAPVDAEQQCGEATQDCVVRTAREWTLDGVKYREIVIDVHRIGHASRAVSQEGGKWPAVAAN